MKHTKKLIPAIGMLLLSASMLVTSTFAWFSMNTEVSATGMKVSAVGDQVYLQIIAGTDSSKFSPTEEHKTVAASTVSGLAAGSLLPAAVVGKVDNFGTEGLDSIPNYTGGTYSWVTNNSNSATSSTATGKYTNADKAATAALAGYYLKNSFMIRLNESAGQTTAAAPLAVSKINIDTFTEVEGVRTEVDTGDQHLSDCVSVLVVCNGYTQLFKQTTYNTWNEVAGAENGNWGKLTADKFNSTDGVQVDIYVFFDGTNSKCTIAGLAESKNDYEVSVSFTVVAQA